jgi:hypothetical protein
VYHSDFWVAAATIGPIVGLAEAVTLARYLRWHDFLRDAFKSIQAAQAAEQEAKAERLRALARDAGRSEGWAQLPEDQQRQVRQSFDVLGDSLAELTIAQVTIRAMFEDDPAINVGRARSLFGLALVAVGLAVASVGVALFSLAGERDVLAPGWIAVGLCLAFVAPAVQSVVEVSLRRSTKKADVGQELPD